MAEKMAAEIQLAYNEEGAAFKRKEEMHRMAEANKAFCPFQILICEARVIIWQGI